MAMERSMSMYSSYSSCAPTQPFAVAFESKASRDRRMQREAEQEADEARARMVARASTCRLIAEKMHEQNEKMIAGLRSVSANQPKTRPEKVDFVARNIADVGPQRSPISRKEQGKLAYAEVLAAATSQLGISTPRSHPRPPAPPPYDTTGEDLVRAAREEMERSAQVSAYEKQTRRPAKAPRRAGYSLK